MLSVSRLGVCTRRSHQLTATRSTTATHDAARVVVRSVRNGYLVNIASDSRVVFYPVRHESGRQYNYVPSALRLSADSVASSDGRARSTVHIDHVSVTGGHSVFSSHRYRNRRRHASRQSDIWGPASDRCQQSPPFGRSGGNGGNGITSRAASVPCQLSILHLHSVRRWCPTESDSPEGSKQECHLRWVTVSGYRTQACIRGGQNCPHSGKRRCIYLFRCLHHPPGSRLQSDVSLSACPGQLSENFASTQLAGGIDCRTAVSGISSSQLQRTPPAVSDKRSRKRLPCLTSASDCRFVYCVVFIEGGRQRSCSSGSAEVRSVIRRTQDRHCTSRLRYTSTV